MRALYRVFEEESQKPGKDFVELVRGHAGLDSGPGRALPLTTYARPSPREIDDDSNEVESNGTALRFRQ